MELGQSSDAMPAPKRRPPTLACDSCCVRKIRCDGAENCAQCVAAGKSCRRTRSRKPRERRHRDPLSDRRQKIDGVEDRLNTLASHVAGLQRSSPAEHPSPGPAAAQVSASADLLHPQPDPGFEGFEGASSLNAHTRFANEFVEKALFDGVTGHMHLDRAEALAALEQLSTSARAPEAMHTPSTELAARSPVPNTKLELPPFAAVAVVLKAEREKSDLSFITWLTRFVTTNALTSFCMDAYFAPTCTDSLLIIVTASLMWLFSNRSLAGGQDDVSSIESHRSHARLCQQALEAAISRLPLCISPTLDATHALVLAALHAVASARSTLAWTLTCKAHEMCQTLGLHRSGVPQNEDPAVTHRKSCLFWMLYMLEKGLSLRMGRSSNIQDFDIAIKPEFLASESDMAGAYAAHLKLCVSASSTQGKVYEKLYSPYALSLSDGVRQAAAHDLSEEIGNLRQALEQSSASLSKQGRSDEQDYFYTQADAVVLLSVLTLVHRAIPARDSRSSFSEQCVDTARKALDLHQQCMKTVLQNGDGILELYMNWSILHTPFIPVIVVFCTTIETADRTDLTRLQEFATSVQTMHDLSRPAERVARLAQVLYNIASRFVELRSAPAATAETGEHYRSNAGFEVDAYLNALGLAPTRRQSTVNGISIPSEEAIVNQPDTNDFFQADPTEFYGWLDDHQQMLDLLNNQDMQLLGTNYFQGVTNV